MGLETSVTGGMTSSNTFIVGTNGLTIGGADPLTLSGNGTLDGTLTVISSATVTLSGVLSGAGGLDVLASVLVLSGANTFSGATTVNGSTVVANNNAAFGTSTVTFLGGTVLQTTVAAGVTIGDTFIVDTPGLMIGGADPLTLSGTVTLNGTLTAISAATITLTGVLSGSGGINDEGTGALILSGANTYSGTTFWEIGTTLIANNNAAFGTSTVDFDGGILETTLAAGVTLANTFIVGSSNGSTISGSDNLTLTGGVTLNATLTVTCTATTTLSGILTGAGGVFVNTGSGTLVLSGANTFSGVTTLATGILEVSNNTALGSNTVMFNAGILEATVAAGVTLTNTFIVGGKGLTIGGADNLALSGNGTLNGNLTVTDTAITTLGGGLSGSGDLIENTTGTLILSGANTYSGTTTLTVGTLEVDNSSALGTGTLTFNGGLLETTVAAGVTLANPFIVGSSGVTIAGADNLTLSGGGTLNSTLTDTSTALVTLSGVLSGSGGGITENANGGVLTLSAVSPGYSGITTVSAGILQVTGTIADSPVNVSGGTLEGTGTVESVTISAGYLSPGVGIGSLGTLTTSAGAFASTLDGASYQVDVNNPATSDQLVIGTGATCNLTGATLVVNVIGSVFGNVYTIVSSPSRGISGIFNGLANDSTFQVGGRTFLIKYTATAVTLTDAEAPTITSANSAIFSVTRAGTFTVSAAGFPAPNFTETGALPSGVTLSSAGVLSGTPALGSQGTYVITLTASNFVGTPATQSFTLFVLGPPVSITSTSGTPQSTTVDSSFATPFQVLLKDSAGDTEGAGINVTFTVYSSSLGAGGTYVGGVTTDIVSTNSSGVATAPALTANGMVGTYLVTASTAGVSTSATFTLTNTAAHLPFSDTFSGSGALSTNWTIPMGTFTQNGTAAVAGSGSTNLALYNGASAADVSVSAQQVNFVSGSHNANLVARYTGNSFYLAQVIDNGTTATASLYVNVGGTYTLLGSSVNVSSTVLGNRVSLRLDIQGNELNFYVGNTAIPTISVLDTHLTGPGLAGFLGGANQNFGTFAATALAPSLPFSDAFSGSGALSTNWTTPMGTFTQNGTAAVAGSGSTNLALYNGASAADVSVSAQQVDFVSGSHNANLVARYTGSNFYLAQVFDNGTTATASLYVNIGGNYTLLGSSVNVSAAVLGNRVNLRLTVQGNELNFYVGNSATPTISVLDSSITGPGLAGFLGGANQNFGTFAATALAPNLPFSDAFSGSGALSTNWTTPMGTFTQNGTAAVAGSGSTNLALYNGASAADVSVSAQQVDFVSGSHNANLVARYTGSNFYLAQVFDNGTTATASLYVNIGGNYTLLGSSVNVSSTVLGNRVNLRLTVQGNELNFYVGNSATPTISVLDTSITGPGLTGFLGGANQNFGTFTASAVAPSLPFSDTFSGSGSLNTASWTTPMGSFTQSGTAAVASSGSTNLALYNGASVADVSVTAQQVDFVSGSHNANLVARYTGNSFYLAQVIDNGTTATASLYVNVGGTYTLLGSSVNVSSTVLGNRVNLRLDIQGNELKFYIGNTAIPTISVLDTHLTGPGLAGFLGGANQNFGPVAVSALAFPFSDSFSGSGSLNAANWTVQTGGFSQNGTQAVASSSSVNIATYSRAATINASVTVQAVNVTGGVHLGGLVARYTATGYYLAQLSNNGTSILAQIYKNIGGTLTLLSSVDVTSQITGPVNLRFDVIGNTLNFYVGSVTTPTVSVVDNSIPSGGLVGLYANANQTFGAFSVTAL